MNNGNITAIIRKYTPTAHFISIKILDEAGRGMRRQLLKAIRWCRRRQIKLVHLSLGSVDYRDFASFKEDDQ